MRSEALNGPELMIVATSPFTLAYGQAFWLSVPAFVLAMFGVSGIVIVSRWTRSFLRTPHGFRLLRLWTMLWAVLLLGLSAGILLGHTAGTQRVRDLFMTGLVVYFLSLRHVIVLERRRMSQGWIPRDQMV